MEKSNLSISVLAACSILYELILVYVSSTIHGDRMVSYALITGLYLLTLGLGSYFFNSFSQKIKTYNIFRVVEIGISSLALTSLPSIYYIASMTDNYIYIWMTEIFFVSSIGFLSGMEIPSISKMYNKDISKVLAFDYVGAFFATLIFAFLFLSYINIFESILVVMFFNLLTLLIISFKFSKNRLIEYSVFIIGNILTVYIVINNIPEKISNNYYNSIIEKKEMCQERNCTVSTIASFETPYQKTNHVKIDYNDINISVECVYIDKDVQICDNWIDSYHSFIATVPLSLIKKENISVLVLGGGDYYAVDKILEDKRVSRVDHVDIDKKFMNYIEDNINTDRKRFSDKRYHKHITDAFYFLKNNTHKYDLIVFDLPLLTNKKLLPLYSYEMYGFLYHSLKEDGIVSDTFEGIDPYIFTTLYNVGFKKLYHYKAHHTDKDLKIKSNKYFEYSDNFAIYAKKEIKNKEFYNYEKNIDILGDLKIILQDMPYYKGIKLNRLFFPNTDYIVKES